MNDLLEAWLLVSFFVLFDPPQAHEPCPGEMGPPTLKTKSRYLAMKLIITFINERGSMQAQKIGRCVVCSRPSYDPTGCSRQDEHRLHKKQAVR